MKTIKNDKKDPKAIKFRARSILKNKNDSAEALSDREERGWEGKKGMTNYISARTYYPN